ncbi:MAG: hypothetical protein ACLUL2_25760 [Blautia sp.]
MKKFTGYINYGVLSAEKKQVWTANAPHATATCSDKVEIKYLKIGKCLRQMQEISCSWLRGVGIMNQMKSSLVTNILTLML